MASSIAILATFLLLKEDPSLLWKVGRRSPVITCTNTDAPWLERGFEVEVEGCKVAETDDFVCAFLVMFACFYIFNLSYEVKLNSGFIFFQKHIFGIKDATKPLTKVLSLISKLAAAPELFWFHVQFYMLWDLRIVSSMYFFVLFVCTFAPTFRENSLFLVWMIEIIIMTEKLPSAK